MQSGDDSPGHQAVRAGCFLTLLICAHQAVDVVGQLAEFSGAVGGLGIEIVDFGRGLADRYLVEWREYPDSAIVLSV
jgi:hypothetical protein